jgi:hypothetical protein
VVIELDVGPVSKCPLWAKSGHLTLFDHLVRTGDAGQPLVERTER